MRRGEIRWYTFALPDKGRPVLVLSRDTVLASLNEVIVIPATRTIRGIETEVVLTEDTACPRLARSTSTTSHWLERSTLVQPLRVSRKAAGPRSSVL